MTANSAIVKDEELDYICASCGHHFDKGPGNFYQNPASRDYLANDKFVHLCRTCVVDMFDEYRAKYDDQKLACLIMCAKLDFPFYESLYETTNLRNDKFSFGLYVRQLNNNQYKGRTFAHSLAEGEYNKTAREKTEDAEQKWTLEEKRAKNEVIKLVGTDLFTGYSDKDRKYLFTEFLQYLNDDELLDDQYKISQLIQLLNNNNQINDLDRAISKLDPVKNIDDFKMLNEIKKHLVVSNEKISKENGFSVRSRGEQKTGKGTLTALMRDMREKDLDMVESNFYDQLTSPASRWASEVSMRSMMENIMLDENDVNDIVENQRELLHKYQNENDDLKEERRLLKIKEQESEQKIIELQNMIVRLGGEIDE